MVRQVSPGRRTRTKESATRKKIDIWLSNLGYDTDEESPTCNVPTERALTEEQNRIIAPYEPDYILYESGTERPIAVIEAKRKGKTLEQAMEYAITKYAAPLNIPIVFATDGTFIKSFHIGHQQELILSNEPITEMIPEHLILRFINEGAEIEGESTVIKHSREQLMEAFHWTNDLLRKVGIREGFDRFIEFSNLLFLKLISEMESEREGQGEERILEKKYCWETFSVMPPEPMLEYINGTVLPHLVDRYNHSGDVFQSKLQISNPKTVKQIVDRLSALSLINADSDVKGDAFEYFLKNSVTVGNDLGEYFTPRHIVKLMVKLVNPQFGETIYDPTCGTGGFLIHAFNHVKKSCKSSKANMKRLKEETVFGRELTNTARIAKMNMIITGDGHTNIECMDCLENPVRNVYDVILANPPYGQLTDYGDLYPIPSTKADSIFVQHIMLSLNENGRAAVIVPEGLLFGPHELQRTRELLLRDFNIIAVISLPQGVFNPYTDSKTNIIVFQKDGKPTKDVWFYILQNDGYDLGKTRKPIELNDIPDLIEKWGEKPNSENSWTVSIADIKDNHYSLWPMKYRPSSVDIEPGMVPFSTFCLPRTDKVTIDKDQIYKQITLRWHGRGAVLRQELKGSEIKTKQQFVVHAGDLIVSKIDASEGAYAIVPDELDGSVVTSDFPVFQVDYSIIDRDYLQYCLQYGTFYKRYGKLSKGTTRRQRIESQDVLETLVYLTGIKEQMELAKRIKRQDDIIVNIDNTQGAMRAGLVDISDFIGDFELVPVEKCCVHVKSGGTPSRSRPDYFQGDIPWVKISDMNPLEMIYQTEESITQEAINDSSASLLPSDTVLLSMYGTIGLISILGVGASTNQAILGFVPDTDKIIPNYLMYYLHTQQPTLQTDGRGVTQKNINKTIALSINVPLPDKDIQQEIIDRIENRRGALSTLEESRNHAEEVIVGIMKSINMAE